MNLVVLISCMHESDHSIIERTNVQTDVVVINQCDIDSEERFIFVDKNGIEHKALFINTTERGLSCSRNMAMKHATDAEICLICDDDERLEDDYERLILKAYENNKKPIDVASFAFNRTDKNGSYPKVEKKMGIRRICKTSSVELSFRIKEIQDAGISFDIKMGSGTGNGGGEDIKFMLDCRRKGLRMRYFPYIIGSLLSYNSQWYHGHDCKLLIDTGWTSRRMFGFMIGYLFILYKVVRDYKDYKKEMSVFSAFYFLNKGFFSKR